MGDVQQVPGVYRDVDVGQLTVEPSDQLRHPFHIVPGTRHAQFPVVDCCWSVAGTSLQNEFCGWISRSVVFFVKGMVFLRFGLWQLACGVATMAAFVVQRSSWQRSTGTYGFHPGRKR
jgi:hypothetical protein